MGFTAASAGTLIYGALSESNKLVVEELDLELPLWPKHLAGYRICLLADLHVRDRYTVDHTQRAVEAALASEADVIAIAGDFVGSWKTSSPWLLEAALGALRLRENAVVAVPGNHDYWNGDPRLLQPICDELEIVLLRNGIWRKDGVIWAGIDSFNTLSSDPFSTMNEALSSAKKEPVVVLWHEPDAVEYLPEGGALMLSGHSHGGQFRFPWGWTPMHTRGGESYVEGYFPEAPTPLYVSRGLGTTGPPSRLGVLPEVTILNLFPAKTSATRKRK